MYIHKVLSYKGSWSLANEIYQSEISEVLSALDEIHSSFHDDKSELAKLHIRDQWYFTLTNRGWEKREEESLSPSRPIPLPRPVPTKNGLGASIPIGIADQVSKWLFQDSAIAVKQNMIKLPVLFLPVRAFARAVEFIRFARSTFEGYAAQIERLAPLSYQYPFLIVGYSDRKNTSPLECHEIEMDLQSGSVDAAIDRCIEFPAEYHQAGLGILNYFGTYLREQYPEEDASVKIEQHGLTVRLVIVTKDGRSEVVEKALHEYELIISGSASPAEFTSNTDLVLDLRNELRVAQFRLESKQDIIGMQNAQIGKLFELVSLGISSTNNVAIDFKPVITLTSDVKVELNLDVVGARQSIKNLLDELPRSNKAHTALAELESSLLDIEKEVDKDSLKKSSAMKRFKEFVDKVVEDGSDFNAAIKKADAGWEIFSDIAKKYNGIAQWCGLPIVPLALLK